MALYQHFCPVNYLAIHGRVAHFLSISILTPSGIRSMTEVTDFLPSSLSERPTSPSLRTLAFSIQSEIRMSSSIGNY